MKFELSGEELSVLLMSLIGRRNNIKNLLNVSVSPGSSYVSSYMSEMKVVEELLEKFFPLCGPFPVIRSLVSVEMLTVSI